MVRCWVGRWFKSEKLRPRCSSRSSYYSAGCPVLPGDCLGRDARGGAVGGSGWLGGGLLGGSRWFGRWFELIDA